ncbi:MAG TPA: hypothetical protein VFS20_11520 [Longimicrobium sp.]|nr:hypothetical protein [Longimicrobium sp.]
MREFEKREKKKVLAVIDPGPDLVDFANHHLNEQTASDDYDAEWLMDSTADLTLALDYFMRWQHASCVQRVAEVNTGSTGLPAAYRIPASNPQRAQQPVRQSHRRRQAAGWQQSDRCAVPRAQRPEQRNRVAQRW